MTTVRRSLAVLALAGASSIAWFVGSNLVSNVQFARAAQEVQSSRQVLLNVNDLQDAYRNVARVVEPSVVKIEAKKSLRSLRGQLPFSPEMLRRYFPDNDGDGEPDLPDDQMLQQGEGSGVIMEADDGNAYIVTNNHVAGDSSEMEVTLHDGRVITDVKLVGTDPKTDLAVIRIKAERVHPAVWGNSDNLQKGDLICAFGSPFGYVGSMTHGIVSALNRQARIIDGPFSYENFIQVDAPINPGNSGGPLVNLKGEVVGINTAILSKTGVFSGIGFAIPSNMVKPVYEELKEHGKVTRGWLGVGIQDVATARDGARSLGFDGDSGVIVISIYRDSPADGTLRPGDVITAVNGQPVATNVQLRNTIATIPPGEEVTLTISREGKRSDVKLVVAEQPTDLLARSAERDLRETPATASAELRLGFRWSNPTDQMLARMGLETSQRGAMVTAVAPNSPAANERLRPGDLIIRIGNQAVTNVQEASAALARYDLRNGVPMSIASKEGTRFVLLRTE